MLHPSSSLIFYAVHSFFFLRFQLYTPFCSISFSLSFHRMLLLYIFIQFLKCWSNRHCFISPALSLSLSVFYIHILYYKLHYHGHYVFVFIMFIYIRHFQFCEDIFALERIFLEFNQPTSNYIPFQRKLQAIQPQNAMMKMLSTQMTLTRWKHPV